MNVYTLGDGLVNAYATGHYTYHEPPKRPAVQVFDGRARWNGTLFAAPFVPVWTSQAGLLRRSQYGIALSGLIAMRK